MGKGKRIVKRLTEVFNKTPEREVQLKDVKWILFSDQHKGSGDGADDFKACKPAYHAALGYYFEGGYTLGLLGDVEDLWENRFKPVLKEYPDTFQLEKKFAADNRYMRLFGNHDDMWDSRSKVARFLRPFILDHPVEEGIRLKFIWNGRELKRRMFLVHGHQGTFDSDVLGMFSRFAVRNIWRPIQRIFRIRSTTPATDFEIRQAHEEAMYEFARASNAVLIAGHTHKPIFESIAYAAKLEAEIAAEREKLGKTSDPGIRKEIQEQIQDLSARLEWERAQAKGISSGMPECPACPEPIVFNTGCCSFSDGDITGIEIEGNTIRLVRWPDDQGNPKKKVLEEADLLQIL